MSKAAAVVLAAGFSQRLGRPKQMVEIGGKTLLERAICVALEAELDPVIVVVSSPWLLPAIHDWGAIGCLNDEASEGMASSIRYGIRAAQALRVDGAVVMACDQVGLTAEHLRLLVADPERVTASVYAGRAGVPAYFPAASFAALQKLQGDVGARALLRDAARVVDERLTLDVDTDADVLAAEQFLREA